MKEKMIIYKYFSNRNHRDQINQYIKLINHSKFSHPLSKMVIYYTKLSDSLIPEISIEMLVKLFGDSCKIQHIYGSGEIKIFVFFKQISKY
jgi:hypothetical protein